MECKLYCTVGIKTKTKLHHGAALSLRREEKTYYECIHAVKYDLVLCVYVCILAVADVSEHVRRDGSS